MEPYRIKVVEPLPVTSAKQRRAALHRVAYNLTELNSDEVTVDLLTDSGTGALSADQMACAITGDQAYAGSRSFRHFAEVVGELTSCPHLLPVSQGRTAERILFTALLQPGQMTLSNRHSTTTRANVELRGAEAVDLPSAEAADLHSSHPFKGDIDTEGLKSVLFGPDADRVSAVIVTLTNGYGQPVSMANLGRTAELCRERQVPLILNAARFAENAWLVSQYETGYRGRTPRRIAQEAFGLADGCVMSARKDGLGHTGGFIGLRDADLARRCEMLLTATVGHTYHGGLAGRDLDTVACGLLETTDERYLRARAEDSRYLAALARAAGIAVVEPPGVHAVYLDAGRLLRHIPATQFPGQALACELYLEAGVRSGEVGSFSLGAADGGSATGAPHELVRLAIPRRVYTRGHLAHVGAALNAVAARADRITGLRLVEPSSALRGTTARLEPVVP
jgi:tryptophanase